MVNCWDGFVEIPFAFHIPFKTVYSSDTFADALSTYISTTVEELSYDNQSLEDIEDYVCSSLDREFVKSTLVDDLLN